MDEVITTIDPPVVVDTTRIFSKTYGTTLSDLVTGVRQTNDGGLIACGYTIAGAFGDNDIFITKTDGRGNIVWSNLYGGVGNDQANSIEKTADGSFIICGTTSSFSGTFDPFAMKINQSGTIEWSKYYRWWNEDYGNSIIQTPDAGYIITGYSNSFSIGMYDVYSLKIDQSGGLMWARAYGGLQNDYGNSITTTPDGGYMIGGYTFSYGANGDAYIVRMYGDGALKWSKTYGGLGFDNIKDIRNVSNGFIACGSTSSFALAFESAYVFNIDNQDGFVYWSRTFGGNGQGVSNFSKVLPAPDGGYLLAGSLQDVAENQQDIALVKLFGDGAFNYSKIFGGVANDAGSSLSFKSDGGILLSANTSSFGAGTNDMYILSLFDNGTGCLPDRPVTPIGGDPVTEVNAQTSAYLDINFYDTEPAGWNVASFSVLNNSQCKINP
ncbi:MAG: hypothetical protein ABI543_14100 [Ignavibacteria bacterium]